MEPDALHEFRPLDLVEVLRPDAHDDLLTEGNVSVNELHPIAFVGADLESLHEGI